jgi:hypothetical protein
VASSILARQRLSDLEKVAVALHVDQAEVRAHLDRCRKHWQVDGAAAGRLADVRSVVSLAMMVLEIAKAHAGCRRKSCPTCVPLRHAVAYALAIARHDAEHGRA